MTNLEIEQIKKNHPFSYGGILHSYNWKEIKTSYPFWVSILLSFIILIATYFSEKNSYEVVCMWTSQILAIFPNLLGFNLGGYALIIGFGNSELVQSMTKKSENKSTTVFQKLSGIFAFAILLQLSAFVVSFLASIFVQLKFSSNNDLIINFINIPTTLTISFLGFWGLFILPNLVSNIFTFGQMHHAQLTTKRIENEKRRGEKESN